MKRESENRAGRVEGHRCKGGNEMYYRPRHKSLSRDFRAFAAYGAEFRLRDQGREHRDVAGHVPDLESTEVGDESRLDYDHTRQLTVTSLERR